MARKPARVGVVYPKLQVEGRPLMIERLRREDVNMQTAKAVAAVMQSAYAGQFEVPQGCLPKDTITQHVFNPDSLRRTRGQHGRMCSHMDTKDSQYWLLWESFKHTAIGLAKVTPRGVEADTPFGYFNDIAVRRRDQHRQYGRAIAYAAIKFGPMPQDQPMALEGYAGSKVNQWFEDEWGMVARGIDPEGLRVGRDILPQVRYVTEAGLAVAGVAVRLEERMPELASAEFVEL